MKARVFLAGCLMALVSGALAMGNRIEEPLAPTPPMGWNSYDSYGTYAHEQACFDNLKTFAETFKPLGYDYFVIDGGWYIEYELQPGTLFPTTDKGFGINMNEDGYFIPSETYFPNGFTGIADECHKNGVKFGVHFLRGMPRKAVELNTPVKGTKYFARDIVNTNSICPWNKHTYGVDMSKPGAQEYYDGWIQLLADYGIDFIKADDIVSYPDEIAAVQKAIAKCGRPMTLSLSPGGRVLGNEIKLYEKADMLRVTTDVWDTQHDIDECFDAWLTWQYVPVREGFWFDMDMIPIGELKVTGKPMFKTLYARYQDPNPESGFCSEVLDHCEISTRGAHISFHCWRHTFGTMLSKAKVDKETRMKLGGWSQESTADIYDHYQDFDILNAAINSLE
jgi:alpha-galactosidase